MTTQESPVKYGDQILRLLEAVHLPAEVSVSHCKGHQKWNTEVARQNQAADWAAKRASLQNNDLIGVATLVPQTNLSETLSYTEAKTLKAKRDFQEDHLGWFQKEGVIFLLGNLQWKLVNSLHPSTHLGEKALQRLLQRSFKEIGLQMTIRQVVSSCPTCQLNNFQRAQRPQLALPVQQCGTYPEEDWQMDFTQMPVSQGYKYLLVMIDTFPGWIEGFPTQAEKAEQVVKKTKTKTKLLHEIIPRFGLLRSLQNDNGTSFTPKVTQGVSKALGITYYLQCSWRPASVFRKSREPTNS